ncbi:MAG: A24 family peptidase [Oscillospiraceae bacterium]|nr:A24 family peptidase [Oscillospiraceae bacterium]
MRLIYCAIGAYMSGIAGGLAISRLAKAKSGERLLKTRRQLALVCALCALGFEVALFYVGKTSASPSESLGCFVTVFFMLWLAVTDFAEFYIPNKVLLIWFAFQTPLVAISAISGGFAVLADAAAGAFVIGVLFLLVYIIVKKKTFGGGDVKFVFVLGWSLALKNALSAVFYGMLLCALFALAGMIAKKLTHRDLLPLAPFLFFGVLVAYLL